MPNTMGLAVWGPLRSQHVARRIAVDDFRCLAAHLRNRHTGTLRVLGGTRERKAITRRAERRTSVRQDQLVVRMTAPRRDPRSSLERHPLVKHHLRAVGRPRRRADLPCRTARAVRIVNAPSLAVSADVANDIAAQNRRIELDARPCGTLRRCPEAMSTETIRVSSGCSGTARRLSSVCSAVMQYTTTPRLSAVHFGLPQKPPGAARRCRDDPSAWTI